jgi:superfamily II DNA or RNA helicase
MAVNEGMDLPMLPVIIIASRTSGSKAHIQRRGRCLRFEEGKESYVFNLYIADTQDEKWLRSSQSTTDPSRIKWGGSLDETIKIINNGSFENTNQKESPKACFTTKNI